MNKISMIEKLFKGLVFIPLWVAIVGCVTLMILGSIALISEGLKWIGLV